MNLEKSANRSRRTTRLSEMVEQIEAPRRSPRFRNEVNSSVNFFNEKFNGSISCNTKSNIRSKNKNMESVDIVDYPATPIGVGEKKFKGVVGKDDGFVTSDLGEDISLNSGRRITRSCSRLMQRKLEAGKLAEDELKGRNLFKSPTRVSKTGTNRSMVESSAVTLDGEVRGKKCNKGKENRSDDCKDITKGSRRVTSGSFSRCVATTRGGRQGRQNNLTDYHVKVGKRDDSCKETVGNLDRRITRSASKQMGAGHDFQCQTIERRSTRISSKHDAGKAKSIKAKREKQEGTDLKEKEIRGLKLDMDMLDKESGDATPLRHISGRGERTKQDAATRDTKLAGVKRKRKQVGLQGTEKGWTKEQEVALNKAYFTAKPSPHFWKNVAKLVPGKSSQECFDKVHSDNQTPVCTKLSVRAKKQNSPSDLLVSGNELFKVAEKKSKRTCKKFKSQVARKTVRHLLQKYSHVNQDNEADLFSVLEPAVNPSSEAFQLNASQLTPQHLMKSPESSSKSRGRSSSGKKCLSRFSYKSQSPLTSPPVLKKVKNMVLHEKYIDQLHIREHKRKLAFSRYMKLAQNQKAGKENSVYMKDIVGAAKDALVSDAKDAINNFRQSQANIMEAFSDSEEFFNNHDDEDEVEL